MDKTGGLTKLAVKAAAFCARQMLGLRNRRGEEHFRARLVGRRRRALVIAELGDVLCRNDEIARTGNETRVRLTKREGLNSADLPKCALGKARFSVCGGARWHMEME
eukprot:2027663-Pleurochrysis_carterae.AAC.3